MHIAHHQLSDSYSWCFIFNIASQELEYYNQGMEYFIQKDRIHEKGYSFLNVAPENITALNMHLNKCTHLKVNEVYDFNATLIHTKGQQCLFDIHVCSLNSSLESNPDKILFTGTAAKAIPGNNQARMQDFIYTAVHDLSAPVRKLSTLIQRFVLKNKNDINNENAVYIEKIESVLGQLTRLIHSLTVLNEISENEISFVSCDLKKIINDVFSDMHNRFLLADVTFDIADLPEIEGDKNQLTCLFQHIIDNAWLFRNETRPLQIILTSKTLSSEEKIANNLPLHKPYFQLVIEDNGLGYEEQYSEVIFQPFQKLSGQKYPGSGLGLTICRKIVENHQGILYATRARESGAGIIIILPKKKFNNNAESSTSN